MKPRASSTQHFMRALLCGVSMLLTANVAGAQGIDCGRLDPKTRVLSFQFTHSFDKNSFRNAQFVLRRMSDGDAIKHSDPRFNDQEDKPNSVEFTLDESLVDDEVYVLYVERLRFGTKSPKMLAPIQALRKCGEPEKPDTPEGRDDANVYLAGMLTTSSGNDLNGTIDAKLRRTFYNTDTVANPDSALISDIGLAFDLKASGDPEADPDSMNFGVEWEMEFARSRSKGPISGLFNYLYPKIESERDFGNTNFLVEHRLKMVLKRPQPKLWSPVFTPFVGEEIGKNIKSPLAAAEGNFLYRIKAGTLLSFFFQPRLENLKTIEFEAEYTRRWPLRRELGFEEDEDKNLTLVEFSKRPRDYVKGNLNFLIKDNFGLTVGYEYGELPPSFKLVDHKLKIGLVFKTK